LAELLDSSWFLFRPVVAGIFSAWVPGWRVVWSGRLMRTVVRKSSYNDLYGGGRSGEEAATDRHGAPRVSFPGDGRGYAVGIGATEPLPADVLATRYEQ
jgi:hypothetical protein